MGYSYLCLYEKKCEISAVKNNPAWLILFAVLIKIRNWLYVSLYRMLIYL